MFDHDAATGAWTERAHVRKAISRITPEAVAGWPTRFGHDRPGTRFEMTFVGDPKIEAPHRLFVPAPDDFAPSFEITCDGVTVGAARDPATGIVELTCGADAQEHTIVIAAK